MNARRVVPLALLVVALIMVVWGLSGGPSPSAIWSAAPTGEQVATLNNSLRAIEDAHRDTPRDRWDPDYVVNQVGRNPDSLAAWVREHTAWIPYRGTLRGPVGVLMDRRGNALDRALLLAELLTRAGHVPQLVRAELTEAQADSLIGRMLMASQTTQGDETAGSPVDTSVRAVATSYDLDAESVARTLEAQQEVTIQLLTELEERTADQAARLLDAVPGPLPISEWAERWKSALGALRDHWWVRIHDGDVWRDLDPAPRDSIAMTLAPSETVAPDAIPPALHHEVVVRVVAERLAGGALVEARALEHVVRPAEVIDQPVVLQFWPAAWPSTGISSADSGRSYRRAALRQQEWSASLMIGRSGVAQAQLVASEAEAAAALSGGLGGVGGAVSRAVAPQPGKEAADADVLTAIWLEYEVRSPGHPARVIRRAVFDLIGTANRRGSRFDAVRFANDSIRLARSLALMMRTDILVLGAHPAPEFVIHAFARDAEASAALLRAVAEPGFTADQQRVDSLLGSAPAGVDPLHTFAVLRQEALGDLGFLDRPTVFTRHRFPSALGPGVGMSDAFDLVANEIGISLAETDGFAARLAQGVWDTNLEALLGGTEGNAAAMFSRDGEWRVVASSSDIASTGLGESARALLARELASGALAVAPDASMTMSGAAIDAWWRIDPVTGDALGIGPLGWGQGVDYGTHLAAIWEMSSGMVYAYSMCHAIPQAANALNILGAEFWRLGLTPSWVTRPPDPNLPEFSIDNPKGFTRDGKDFFAGKGKAGGRPTPGKDFEEVAWENNRKCVLDAIRSGFLATAPILLMHLRAELMLKRMPRFMPRMSGGPLVGGRRPPRGFRGRPPTPRRGPRVSRGGRGSPVAPPAPSTGTPAVPGPHRYSPQPANIPPQRGSGPFQGDAANREWHRANWHPDPTQAHPATRALGSPVIYDNADRAALARYHSARASGLSDEAAHAESFKEWWESVQTQRRARGVYQFPGMFPAEPGGGAWQEWVPDHPIGSPSPPPGSPPPGAAGGSPMATSTGPAPAPGNRTSPLTDPRMAVGLAGLTGSKP